MQTRSVVLAAVCALTTSVFAQEAPQPPTQLAKFSAVLGTWHGSGTTVTEAGGDPLPWTASMEVSRILGGFFVQEELQVEVGAPTPMHMRTLYGYDTENQRYVAFSMSNAGPSHFSEYHFPERGVMMVGGIHVEDGKPVIARSLWRMGRNELTYSSEVAEGTGAMRPYVDGKFQRADAKPAQAVEASFAESPVPAEIAALTKRMAGTYGVQGAMTMMPGMPEMKITGTETVTSRFGGHVLCSVVTGKSEGDDAEYVAHNYMSWNAHDRCYDMVGFDNMGVVGKAQGRWAGDDQLVTTWSGLMMGEPTVTNGVVKFGAHGMASVSIHAIAGVNPPMKMFSATYARQDD